MNNFKVDGLIRALTRQLEFVYFQGFSLGFLNFSNFVVCFLSVLVLTGNFQLALLGGHPGCEVPQLINQSTNVSTLVMLEKSPPGPVSQVQNPLFRAKF